jgi:predicted HTH transcriptional regulator
VNDILEGIFGEFNDEDGKPSQATKLLRILEGTKEWEIFKTPAGEPFVTFQPNQHQQCKITVPADDEKFTSFLGNTYLKATKNLCSREAIKTVISHLSGNAHAVRPVHVRIGHYGGKIYIDLANNSDKPFVEISSSGWNLISLAPIAFWRPVGLAPLPMPIRGGSLDALHKFVNVDDAGFKRLLAFLLSTFADGPQLVVLLLGGKGTAKTTAARVIRRLLDPSAASETTASDDDRDLFLSCRHQWLLVIDNVGILKSQRSNVHCTIATGAARRERLLYTNNQEFMFSFRRPQILTSIKDVITKSDLADRKSKIELNKIDSRMRKPEKKLYAELNAEIPKILGAVYVAVAGALAELPTVQDEPLPRMVAGDSGSWDQRKEETATLDDLDNDAISDFFERLRSAGRRDLPVHMDSRSVFEKMRLVVDDIPTRAAILLLGKDPKRFFSTAYVKAGRFKSATEILDDREFGGTVFEQLDRAMGWLQDRMSKKYVVGKSTLSGKNKLPGSLVEREENWDYPLASLREAIINAVCHRDYMIASPVSIRLFDDRLEIWNPGNLPAGLSAEELLKSHPSRPPNRLLADCFYETRIIERWGMGTLTMAKALETHKQPPPSFDNASPNTFKVVMFASGYSDAELLELRLNERQVRAVRYLQINKRMSNAQYQQLFEASKATASRDLTDMTKKGLVARTGTTGKGTSYVLAERKGLK